MNTKLHWLSYTITSCLKPYLPKEAISWAAYNEVLYQILLTHLLSLALLAEPLAYRIYIHCCT